MQLMLAYFDCFSGISGDMTVAALLDLGLEQDYLEDQLATLGLEPYTLNVWRSKRQGLAGVRFEVKVGSDQPHRRYADIRRIIEDSHIGQTAKSDALKVFELLAEAESKVHGVAKDDVHFHEVGAVDSIVDTVAVAVGIDRLGIQKVICSPLPLSRGFVKTAHGVLPTPAPATLEILKNVPVFGTEGSMELVTPTGAAIARAFTSSFDSYPSFAPIKIGYGLGKSDPKEFPNALRVVLGDEVCESALYDRVGIVECQVDDLDPRILGHLMDALLTQGALDVTFQAVQMKKNRPGTLVRALVPPDRVSEFSSTLLTHTTTLGVRVFYSHRIVLPRESEVAVTSLGKVRVKVVRLPAGPKEKRPEFDDISAISRRTGLSCREVMRIVDRELNHRQ